MCYYDKEIDNPEYCMQWPIGSIHVYGYMLWACFPHQKNTQLHGHMPRGCRKWQAQFVPQFCLK